MALSEPIRLPICDKCGRPFLPHDPEARLDPRAYDAKRRAAGLKGLRCGGCKTYFWDVNNPDSVQPKPAFGKAKPDPVPDRRNLKDVPGRSNAKDIPHRKRCRHGLRNCTECA